MVHTMGIMYSSSISSMGMSTLSGGMMQPSVSFGFGSYNFGTNEFRSLFNWGDLSTMEKIGYTFGALANVQDVFAWNVGTNVDVHAKYEATGHSTVSRSDNSISISVGPSGGIPVNPGSKIQMELEWLWKAATKKWRGMQFGEHASYEGGWHYELKNVNRVLLENMTKNINEGKGLFGIGSLRYGLGFGCVQHTSRALWRVGVPTLPINFHPLMLNTQLLVRDIGIYTSPYLINF